MTLASYATATVDGKVEIDREVDVDGDERGR